MAHKFNFLDARIKPATAETTKPTKIRHSSISKIVAGLQLEHPDMDESQILAKAKAIWCQRTSGSHSANRNHFVASGKDLDGQDGTLSNHS